MGLKWCLYVEALRNEVVPAKSGRKEVAGGRAPHRPHEILSVPLLSITRITLPS
jgi:hypothetical protein